MLNSMLGCLVVSVVVMSAVGEAAKILGFMPFYGLSHNRVVMPLFYELAERGHNVTVVGYHEPKTPHPNYKTILLKLAPGLQLSGFFSMDSFYDATPLDSMRLLKRDILEPYNTSIEGNSYHRVFDDKYDLVIAEYFESDLFSSYEWKIDAPVILFHTSEPLPWHRDSFGDPLQPSIVQHAFAINTPAKGFVDRFWNTVELAQMMWYYHKIITPRAQEIAEKHLGPLPPLAELTKNASLYFTNTHFGLHGPKPINPSTIEVGGLHVSKAKPLPKDLQTLFDNAKHGVVYFSMGSVLRGTSILPKHRETLLKVFGKLKQTVLWKWEEDLPGKPANVHTSPWFPQRDIFAHPNLVLYIGHCGLLGVHEAVTEAVPTICIPLFGDQFFNAALLKNRGMGLHLKYANLDESSLTDTIQRVITNSSFKANARLVSAAFTDRPLSAMDTAVYWSEYVIRHRGAPHIKSPARHMAWWEYYNVDVLATLFLIAISILIVGFKLLHTAISLIVRQFSSHSDDKLKRN